VTSFRLRGRRSHELMRELKFLEMGTPAPIGTASLRQLATSKKIFDAMVERRDEEEEELEERKKAADRLRARLRRERRSRFPFRKSRRR
jgi:hypothetical protein